MEPSPLRYRAPLWDRVVIRAGDRGLLDMLNPSPWFHMADRAISVTPIGFLFALYSLYDSLEKLIPVRNTTYHTPDVDVVKVILWVRPRLVHVVNLEAYIWRNEARLNRGYVHACHFRGWVLIREVAGSGVSARDLQCGSGTLHRPRPCTAANIEDSLDSIRRTLYMAKLDGWMGLTSGSEMGASLVPPRMTVYIW